MNLIGVWAVWGVLFSCVGFSEPTWNVEKVELPIAKEGKSYSIDLVEYVSTDGYDVSFKVFNKPEWLTLKDPAKGTLSGTPERKDVGFFDELTFVLEYEGGSPQSVRGELKVEKTPKMPKWVAQAGNLKDALEDKLYSVDLSSDTYFSNPEGYAVKFQKVNGASWLSVSQAGALYGTPGKEAANTVADITVKFSATIPGQTVTFDQSAKFQLRVLHVNHAPQWKSHLFNILDAKTAVDYVQDLKGSVTDKDNDRLEFTVLSQNQTWASLSSDGILKGRPAHKDVGVAEWKVRVSDGTDSDTATIRANIIKTNEKPVWNASIALPVAQEDFMYQESLVKYVQDPDNDKLVFSKVEGPDWVTVTTTGILSGKPTDKDIGITRLKLLAQDNIAGSALADVFIEVKHTNHLPYWILNPVKFEVFEDKLFKYDISGYARDSDYQDRLAFSLTAGKSWLQISPEGVLTGTGKAPEIGDNKFTVTVDDGQGGRAPVEVIVQVVHVNHSPKWESETIDLGSINEDESVSKLLASYASDVDKEDQGKLVFTKLSAPSWVRLASDGSLTGTPSRIHVGLNKIRVQVKDTWGVPALTLFQVQVLKVNKAPFWLQTPIDLGSVTEGSSLSKDISGFAKDIDGDTLKFSLKQAPPWMALSINGILTGTPGENHVGNFSLQIEVSDGQLSNLENAKAFGVVKLSNKAPLLYLENLRFQVKERDIKSISLNDKKYVEDKNGDSLTFRLENAPSWLRISSEGVLFAEPLHNHLGIHTPLLSVSDGELTSKGEISLQVIRDPRPPIWFQDPLPLVGVLGQSLNVDLKSHAKDLDGVPLQFAKVSGAGWVSISPEGLLSGAPPTSGISRLRVSATNDAGLSNVADVQISVSEKNLPPKWSSEKIKLEDAEVGTTYLQKISSYVQDPNGDRLSFKLESGPDWLRLTDQGTLIGTSNVGGEWTLMISANDNRGESVEGELILKAKYTQHAKNPLSQDSIKLLTPITQLESVEVFLGDKLLQTNDWNYSEDTGVPVLVVDWKNIPTLKEEKAPVLTIKYF